MCHLVVHASGRAAAVLPPLSMPHADVVPPLCLCSGEMEMQWTGRKPDTFLFGHEVALKQTGVWPCGQQ